MAGPTGHEWLAAVLHSVEYNSKEDKITVDGNDWRNMVELVRQALKIPRDATDDGKVLARGLMYRAEAKASMR